MSLGQTTSAPASAWLTAVLASSSSETSFRISLALDDAAVAVRRVLAEADVGEEHEPGRLLAERAQGPLDDPVLVVGARADLVLLLGDAEEDAPRGCRRAAPRRPPRQSSSTERCAIPGSPSSGRSTPSPGQTKSG